MQKLYNQKFKFGKSLPNHYSFVSNMGAGEPSPLNLKSLKKLLERKHEWEEQDKENFNTIFETIKSKMGDCDEATLRDFCLSLDIQTWQPTSNSKIRRRNCDELGRILYRTQSIHFEPPNIENIYESILHIVREANTVEEDASLDRSVEKKTIYPHHIRECIAYSPAIPDYLERVEIPSDEFDEKDQQELTTLQEKTQKALWDPDAITYLMDLRASAKIFYKKWRVFNQARKRLEHLSLKVQRACIGVKADAHNGVEQWKLLEKRLEELAERDRKAGHKPEIDVDYLFGVVGGLTGKCKNRWA